MAAPTGIVLQGIGEKLIGSFLDDLTDKVQKTMDGVIEKAEGAAQELISSAGSQINLAIQNAKNAYQEELNKTVDKVSNATSNVLNQLNGIVIEFQENAQTTASDLADRAQVLANTLPFSNLQPQLRKTTPHFVVLGNSEIILKFEGNFPSSADPKFKPTLSFNNKEVVFAHSTTLELGFKANGEDLFPSSDNNNSNHFSYVIGTLKVPYDNTASLSWYWRMLGYTDIKTFEYKVLENALPSSPGKITAVYSHTERGTPIVQHYVSPTISENASHAYRSPHGLTDAHHYTTTADPGFEIVAGTAQLKIHPSAHGNHSESITSVTNTTVVSEIRADACSGKHMGIVAMHVEFDEKKETTKTEEKREEYELKWNEAINLQLESTTTGRLVKIIFEGFDRSRNEFGTATDLSNRYVKIHNQGSSLEIKAEIPRDIVAVKA